MTLFLFTRYGNNDSTRAGVKDPIRLLGLHLNFSRPAANRFPTDIEVILESDNEPDDCFIASTMLTISDKLRSLFVEFDANCEYHSVKVRSFSGNKIDQPYYYLNVLDTVENFDWEHSIYTLEQEYATKIAKIVLKPIEYVPPLFYIARTVSPVLCVRDDLLVAMEQAGYKGPKFVPEDQWVGPGKFLI